MRRRRNPLGLLLVVVALLAAACSDGSGGSATTSSTTEVGTEGRPTTTVPAGDGVPPEVADRIRIEVLSSQPDRVTGDEARIRVSPVRGGDPAALRVSLGSTDVTAELAPTDIGDDGAIEGVVTGLVEGTNSLTATAGEDATTLRLRAWPRQGPMFSGPQTPLPVCATEALDLGAGASGSCGATARATWRTIAADGAVADLAEPTAGPSDGTATATVDGEDVPAVVRVEHGVVNRSTYEVAVLDRAPGRPDAQLDAAWNRRLVVRFDDGCGAGHAQGVPGSSALEPALLLQGYAVVTASFTTGAVQCNDVVAAETVMMLRERVVELLGEVDLTIGDGTGFGGAMAHLIVQNYPTLLDGVVTVDAHPDATSTANQVADCLLLLGYLRSPDGAALDEAGRTAVAGRASLEPCRTVERDLGTMFDPVGGCDPAVPADLVYDPTDAPDGLRCTFQDLNAIPFGIDEATGFANRPVDNVGVQYGLAALNSGALTVDAFLDLNEGIGGLDVDGRPQAERSEIDPWALQALYENGRVAMGTGDLRKVPIIDVVHAGGDAPGDLHQVLGLRYRLTRGARAESVAPGHQIWAVPTAADDDPTDRASAVSAIEVLDRWLTSMQAEGGASSLRTARPDDALSRCGDDATLRGADVFDRSTGSCLDPDRPAGDARIVAGAPPTGDVIKCELKPVDERDYDVSFTGDQYERLATVFPDGVCDWTLAGSGQTLPTMPDRSFEDVEVPADLA